MDTSKKVQAHYKIKEREFDVFFDQLTFEYKLLKKLTHECQAKCFDKAESTRKQSEQCARTCLDPYLYVRKQVGDKLQQCDQLFQQQEPKCIEDKDLDGILSINKGVIRD